MFHLPKMLIIFSKFFSLTKHFSDQISVNVSENGDEDPPSSTGSNCSVLQSRIFDSVVTICILRRNNKITVNPKIGRFYNTQLSSSAV